MKKYVTIGIATLPAGTVMELSDVQAVNRRHALQAIGKGVYRATAPVQFKVGETIGLDAEPSKAQAEELVDEKEVARRAASDKAKRNKAEAENRAKLMAEAEAAATAALLARLPAELRTQVEKALAVPGV